MPSLTGAPRLYRCRHRGAVRTIVATPLVAYGMNGRRRPALLLSAVVLITANIIFAVTPTTTPEW
ncbi:hypothetical protein [Kribbella pratensis]|nr:hypothetical protein [Kribbella pratensis]